MSKMEISEIKFTVKGEDKNIVARFVGGKLLFEARHAQFDDVELVKQMVDKIITITK